MFTPRSSFQTRVRFSQQREFLTPRWSVVTKRQGLHTNVNLSLQGRQFTPRSGLHTEVRSSHQGRVFAPRSGFHRKDDGLCFAVGLTERTNLLDLFACCSHSGPFACGGLASALLTTWASASSNTVWCTCTERGNAACCQLKQQLQIIFASSEKRVCVRVRACVCVCVRVCAWSVTTSV